jgi:hypothetical protein
MEEREHPEQPPAEGERDDPRDALQLDPDAPPAEPNAAEPHPQAPLKDQGDPLSEN